jgi:hypothetical protein
LLVGKHGMSSVSLSHCSSWLLLSVLIFHRIVVDCPIGEFECIPLYRPRGVVR